MTKAGILKKLCKKITNFDSKGITVVGVLNDLNEHYQGGGGGTISLPVINVNAVYDEEIEDLVYEIDSNSIPVLNAIKEKFPDGEFNGGFAKITSNLDDVLTVITLPITRILYNSEGTFNICASAIEVNSMTLATEGLIFNFYGSEWEVQHANQNIGNME